MVRPCESQDPRGTYELWIIILGQIREERTDQETDRQWNLLYIHHKSILEKYVYPLVLVWVGGWRLVFRTRYRILGCVVHLASFLCTSVLSTWQASCKTDVKDVPRACVLSRSASDITIPRQKFSELWRFQKTGQLHSPIGSVPRLAPLSHKSGRSDPGWTIVGTDSSFYSDETKLVVFVMENKGLLNWQPWDIFCGDCIYFTLSIYTFWTPYCLALENVCCARLWKCSGVIEYVIHVCPLYAICRRRTPTVVKKVRNSDLNQKFAVFGRLGCWFQLMIFVNKSLFTGTFPTRVTVKERLLIIPTSKNPHYA